MPNSPVLRAAITQIANVLLDRAATLAKVFERCLPVGRKRLNTANFVDDLVAQALMPLVPRFILWLLVCAGGGAVSFFFGAMAFEEPFHIVAMTLGIVSFAIGYTMITGTEWFARFRRRPFVSRTLKIGFASRVLLSLASIAIPFAAMPDIYCGMVSVSIVMGKLAEDAQPLHVYIITLVQGTLLNLMLMVFMSLIWGVQRLFMKPPPAQGLCQKCGYDLRASPQVCPECGTPVEVIA